MPEKFFYASWDTGERVEWDGYSPKPASGGDGTLTVRYPELTKEKLLAVFADPELPEGLWRYFDFLPLERRANVVSYGEGNVPIERWRFLEAFARDLGNVDCRVYVHRHDLHPATGSFKDLAGGLVASAMKERGVKGYVVASTGNTAAAMSRYLAAGDCTLYAFIPDDATSYKEADIACFGQNVFRVEGDYAAAKRMAAAFAAAHGHVPAGGTFDPFRIEAKRTMAFDWYRRLDAFPTVYIQAVSGGTGPVAIAKAADELIHLGLIHAPPRMLLVQPSECDPMAKSWAKAKSDGFPDAWNLDYHRIEHPVTEIPTLATGDPTAYPKLAPIVRETGGELFAFPEPLAPDVARVVAFEAGARIGSAAAVGIGGFIEAVKRRLVRNGDVVVVTAGDGIQRDPDFMHRIMGESHRVREVSECTGVAREAFREVAWRPIVDYVNDRSESRVFSGEDLRKAVLTP